MLMSLRPSSTPPTIAPVGSIFSLMFMILMPVMMILNATGTRRQQKVRYQEQLAEFHRRRADIEKAAVASITDARARDEFGGHYVWVRPDAADLAELARLADAGNLTPEIAEVFDLADAASSHERSESGHVRGKIVVRVASE